jgi:hypothetical protein
MNLPALDYLLLNRLPCKSDWSFEKGLSRTTLGAIFAGSVTNL